MRKFLATAAAAVAAFVLGTTLVVATAAGPSPAPRIASGAVSCNLDSGGFCTVQHTLGVKPESVTVSPDTPGNFNAFVLNTVNGSYTESTFRVRAMFNQTTPKAGGTIWFTYVATAAATPVTPSPTTSSSSITPAPPSSPTVDPALAFQDDFNGTSVDTRSWGIYDGTQASTGEVWSKNSWTVSNGVLRGSSGPQGQIPGMANTLNQKYGRWDVRARFSAPADPGLNPVFLLWPQNDASWPAGGEVDFTENYDPNRQYTEGWLHYGASNSQSYAGRHAVDMTQWHTYSVVWAPDHISFLIDNFEWFRDSNVSHLPPGVMHLTLQMNSNGANKTAVKPTWFEVDSARVFK